MLRCDGGFHLSHEAFVIIYEAPGMFRGEMMPKSQDEVFGHPSSRRSIAWRNNPKVKLRIHEIRLLENASKVADKELDGTMIKSFGLSRNTIDCCEPISSMNDAGVIGSFFHALFFGLSVF